MSTRREQEERFLAEAEEFLEKHSLTVHVQNFLDDEGTKRIIADAHSEIVTRISEMKQNAPAELHERAEELYKVFSDEDAFNKNVIANFKIRIHTSFMFLPENVVQLMAENGLLKKSFAEGKEAFTKDVVEISGEMKAELISSFMDLLYDGYVPQGIPAEAADFIRMLGGGGPLIPLNAIFPDFGTGTNEPKRNQGNAHSDKKGKKGKK